MRNCSDISWILLNKGIKPTKNLVFFTRRWQLPQQPNLGKEKTNLPLQNIPNFPPPPVAQFAHYQTLQDVPQTSQILFSLQQGQNCLRHSIFLMEIPHFCGNLSFHSVLQSPQHSWWLQCLCLGSDHRRKENRAGLHLFAVGSICLQDINYFLPPPCMVKHLENNFEYLKKILIVK